MKFKLPIKTVSEANKFEHWGKSAKRHSRQKQGIYFALKNRIDENCLPCTVKITRIAPRKLDSFENLPMSLKYINDAICELLVPNKAIGQADSDKRITTICDQKKGDVGEYAIEIEIIKSADYLEAEIEEKSKNYKD